MRICVFGFVFVNFILKHPLCCLLFSVVEPRFCCLFITETCLHHIRTGRCRYIRINSVLILNTSSQSPHRTMFSQRAFATHIVHRISTGSEFPLMSHQCKLDCFRHACDTRLYATSACFSIALLFYRCSLCVMRCCSFWLA